MSGLPKITMVGNLTGDPEITMTPSGVARVVVNIACTERKYNKQTSKYEDGDPTYVRGTVWRNYGENVVESLNKGDKVIVIGQLKQRSWEKDGQRRSTLEMDIEDIGPALRFVTVTVKRGDKVAAGWGTTSDEPAW